MKFKTTIEVTSEADNKDEAMEIVGEFLSGNIVSGVGMKCRTHPIHRHYKAALGAVALFLLISATAFSLMYMRSSNGAQLSISGFDAVQVPLKTAIAVNPVNGEFKKEWQAEHTKEALKLLKK